MEADEFIVATAGMALFEGKFLMCIASPKGSYDGKPTPHINHESCKGK